MTNPKLRDLGGGGSELICQSIEAEGERCSECREPAHNDKLLMFATKIGSRTRIHDGLFCSKDCHDRWHGLKARRTP